MNRFILSAFLICSLSLSSQAQVVINEVIFGGATSVEIKNLGAGTVDLSTYQLCSFPTYNQLQNLTIISGALNLGAGELLVVSGHSFNIADDELGLYTASGFSNPANIEDYVEWGSTGHTRSSVAVMAGQWVTGDFIVVDTAPSSIEFDGEGNSAADWDTASNDSQGQENSNVSGDCEASATAIGSQSVCEGSAATFQLILGGIGPWTFTYSYNGVIQDAEMATTSPHPWVLDEEGDYNLVSVSDSECEGIASGSVTVNFVPAPTGELSGNEVFCSTDTTAALSINFTGQGPFTFDFQIDGVSQGPITTATNPYPIPVTSAGNYVLTSLENNSCLGEAIGSISVSFQVLDAGIISYNGSTEAFSVCVDDGLPEQLLIDVAGNMGSESQIIITDENGILLSAPPAGPFDLEGGDAGVCLIWHIAYEDFIDGLVAGNQMPDDLSGCFDLSGPLTVIRQTGNDCQVGLDELDAVSDLRLFPNPVVDQLNVVFDSEEDQAMEWTVVDMSGRVIQREQRQVFAGANRWSLDLVELEAGMYMLLIRDEEGRITPQSFMR